MSAPVHRSARIRPPKRGRLAAKEPCADPLVLRGRLYCPKPPNLRRPEITPPVPVAPRPETQPAICTLLDCIWLVLRRLLDWLLGWLLGPQPSDENACRLQDCPMLALAVLGLLALLILALLR